LAEPLRTDNNVERRRSSRFPIEREVRYKTLSQRAEVIQGAGKTLNISSSGVLFTADHELPVGTRLEVSISWPAQLNEKCLLNLVNTSFGHRASARSNQGSGSFNPRRPTKFLAGFEGAAS
jgi:hypothetical protein